LAKLPEDRRTAVAGAATDLAVEVTGVQLPSLDPDVIENLVEVLNASAPAQARAASAAFYMARRPAEPDEAIYEAITAIGSEPKILAIVQAG
jgi:hypothetical protein